MNAAERRSMTAGEYLAMDRDSEQRYMFCAGEVFAMTGASRRHNLYASDMRVHVQSADLYTYPDVVVACPPIEMQDGRNDVLLNPRVLVEVLSPSTADFDRGTKFNHYRQLPSLMEYLLVEQQRMSIEKRSRRPQGDWLMEVCEGEQAEVTLASIGCTLRLAEVYAKVQFD